MILQGHFLMRNKKARDSSVKSALPHSSSSLLPKRQQIDNSVPVVSSRLACSDDAFQAERADLPEPISLIDQQKPNPVHVQLGSYHIPEERLPLMTQARVNPVGGQEESSDLPKSLPLMNEQETHPVERASSQPPVGDPFHPGTSLPDSTGWARYWKGFLDWISNCFQKIFPCFRAE